MRKQGKLTNLVNRPSEYVRRTYLQKMALTNKKLRMGDVSTISDRTGYSSTHVSDTLSGKQVNKSIVNFAFNMTRGRIANIDKIQALEA